MILFLKNKQLNLHVCVYGVSVFVHREKGLEGLCIKPLRVLNSGEMCVGGFCILF